jgi:aspartyl protease family protein
MRRAVAPLLAGLALLLAAHGAAAQSVSLQGALGTSKALLMINGQTATVAVGATVNGVTLKSVSGDSAEVVVGGKTLRLALGGSQVSVGSAAGSTSGNRITIPVGLGGHFITGGAINGKPVQFMVDTGATLVAMGRPDADRLGIDWKSGRKGMSATAGGNVPAYLVNLTRVRVGEVEVYNVDAVVVGADMPHVLLGNSFLSRFSMMRESDTPLPPTRNTAPTPAARAGTRRRCPRVHGSRPPPGAAARPRCR